MSKDDGDGQRGDQQLVPFAPPKLAGTLANPVGTLAKAGGGEATAIVEYVPAGTLLREDEEDLEVKLRRIIDNVPVRVSNTSGSSAGSGSGDFHQYRQMRRREQDRVARMDVDYKRRKELAEFNMRREERLNASEVRTAKKRSKRLKKKQKKKEKKTKTESIGGEDTASNKEEEESSDDDEES